MKRAITHYRALHRIPEVSGQEFKTSAYLENQLRNAGLNPIRAGKTNLIADILVDEALPWVVFRADMDALPIQENSGVDFPSQHDGVMHACGHDAHCAMLLTAAQMLAGQQLPQNVRFLFQSAEETTMGARELVDFGAIPANTAACFGFHVWPGLPEGTIATTTGPMMASGDVFRVHFTGESMHCAVRPKAGDALRAAVQLAASLPRIESLAQGDGSMVFCGSIHSGTSHNIVPSIAEVYGTIRSFSETSRQRLIRGVEAAAAELSQSNQVSGSIRWEGGCPPIANDAGLVKALAQVLPGLSTQLQPSLTGEDFALYQRLCPGVLMWLGNGASKPLHHEAFRVSEGILSRGVDAWLRLAKHSW